MKEYIESICRSCFHSYVCEQFNEHRNSLNEKCHFFNDHFVSAADVVERKRGEWEYRKVGRNCVGIYCTHCGVALGPPYRRTNFCPNCGADMREVDHAD